MKGRGPCHDRVRRERLLGSGDLPSFRDVIRHFELLGRLTMYFPSQTPVIFSLSPVSRVPFLFVLFSLMIPVSCSLFCFWTESPSLICLTIQNGGWHHGKRALRSPFSVLRSPLSALRSPLSALRSPFSIRSLTDHYVRFIYSLFHNVN